MNTDLDQRTGPYFIGVFDTVASLANKGALLILTAALVGLVLLTSAGLWYLYPSDPLSYWSWILIVTTSTVVGIGIAAVLSSFKSAPTVQGKGRTAHFEWGRLRFYDRALSDSVQYGKHALALDENRADFERVRWGDPQSTRAEKDYLCNKTFEQVWFAGNHSDVGGGYSENESRLSDIALGWMIDAAIAVPHPIKIDRSVLHLHPDPAGMQHDECKAGIAYVTWYTGKTWKLQHRALPGPKTTIDHSVRQRFEAGSVLQCDRVLPYRPENVRIVDAYKAYFENLPDSECDCATCRHIRGLPPLPTLKSVLAKNIENARTFFKNIRSRVGQSG